jgi:putative transposase
MARQPRIEYEGAIYHVMNRGDRREEIVLSDEDRELFVGSLAEACVKCGWEVHAWCLMNNHFHLLRETPFGNLVSGMKWFLGAYTIRFNARHRLRGHLFAGRYKSLIVDDRDARYLRTVADYVHLNPARAGLVKPRESLDTFQWSSYGDYLKPPSRRPKWLRADRVMGEHGVGRDDRLGRIEFAMRMEALRREESEGSDYKEIRRGWRPGSEEFISRMLDRINGRCGESQTRRELGESMEQRANRIVSEGLRKVGWSAERLKTERKGHPIKVALAKELRGETTMTLRWIAENLAMGTWAHVSNRLRSIES